MSRYWQKKPLVIRGAIPRFEPLLSREALFDLAGVEAVESRLVERRRGRWRLEHGPFDRAALPAVTRRAWTLLVQGVDLHDDGVHALLKAFRFVPDARLDDVMISWASEGGGVGPHVDSYDVFLLQAQGSRRWRIGRAADTRLVANAPLKILERFEPEQEYLLEPGDMLYLPPAWAHDGTAETNDCMTYSIGFRAPSERPLAALLVQRLIEEAGDDALYRDPRLAAVRHPARVPSGLERFAARSLRCLSEQPAAIACALGEVLTEPKEGVAFDEPAGRFKLSALMLDRRTRMMYDGRHVFINGDSYRAAGPDAAVMRRLANDRCLDAHAVRAASEAARALLREWFRCGWLRGCGN